MFNLYVFTGIATKHNHNEIEAFLYIAKDEDEAVLQAYKSLNKSYPGYSYKLSPITQVPPDIIQAIKENC